MRILLEKQSVQAPAFFRLYSKTEAASGFRAETRIYNEQFLKMGVKADRENWFNFVSLK